MMRVVSGRWVIIVLALCLSGKVLAAAPLTGRVVAISDGDTLTLMTLEHRQHRIRLGGIDAPEKGQPFGERSRQNLARLTHGKEARVDCPKTDRYGRAICTAFVAGEDVGLSQVRDGMAWWYRRYANEQSPEDRRLYETAETEARRMSRGLWHDKQPVAPWEWRRKR